MVKLNVGDNVQFVNKGKLINGEVLKIRDLTVEPLKMASVIVHFPIVKRSRKLYTIKKDDGSIRSYYGRSMILVRKLELV